MSADDGEKEYLQNVKWLREHVPPDDIYDFAQQSIMGAQYFLALLHKAAGVQELMQTDSTLSHWVNNLFCIQKMKDTENPGIVHINWRKEW